MPRACYPDVPNNTAGRFRVETGDVDAAFAEAQHITRIKIRLERSTAAPLECRAIAARWEAVTGELTVWDSTQSTVSVRGALATVLHINEDKVRVIAPNVGGGFGQKIMMFYPDELLVPLASMELGARSSTSRTGSRISSARPRNARRFTPLSSRP